jgi:hypothetical protein
MRECSRPGRALEKPELRADVAQRRVGHRHPRRRLGVVLEAHDLAVDHDLRPPCFGEVGVVRSGPEDRRDWQPELGL